VCRDGDEIVTEAPPPLAGRGTEQLNIVITWRLDPLMTQNNKEYIILRCAVGSLAWGIGPSLGFCYDKGNIDTRI
jgi:hypothetical protein